MSRFNFTTPDVNKLKALIAILSFKVKLEDGAKKYFKELFLSALFGGLGFTKTNLLCIITFKCKEDRRSYQRNLCSCEKKA